MALTGISNLFKDCIYTLVGLAARAGVRTQTRNGVLVVRVDEIGDFILWRPFFKVFRESDRWKDRDVVLCGNRSWKELYETFDADSRAEALWMDKVRFKKDMVYRYRFLRDIWRRGFEVVVNPTFSRDKRFDDAVVRAASARHRYGMLGSEENVRWYDRGYDRNMYTHVLHGKPGVVFEFLRNGAFSEFLTGVPASQASLALDKDRCPKAGHPLPTGYFLIFTGSRSPTRLWPVKHFVRVAEYLAGKTGWTAVLCGGPSDRPLSEAFARSFRGACIDLTGRTRLPELMTIISGARCVITVDTGSVHMAAALGARVFAVFNGSQYGRFAPYPVEVTEKVHCIYPRHIRSELADPDMVLRKYRYKVDIPYDTVSADDLMESMESVKSWTDA